MNFSGVNLVEQRHHDENIENNREMLWWGSMELALSSTVNIEHFVTWKLSQFKFYKFVRNSDLILVPVLVPNNYY